MWHDYRGYDTSVVDQGGNSLMKLVLVDAEGHDDLNVMVRGLIVKLTASQRILNQYTD